MSLPADAPPAPAPSRWPRVLLIAVAALELFGALSDLPSLFQDYGHTTRLLIFAQALTSVRIALAPLLAGTALALALIGRGRAAIVALAILILAAWLTDLPSIAVHVLEMTPDFGGVSVLLHRLLYPAIAIAAIVLAARNIRLGLAALLVALPTVFFWLGFLVFAIGVSIYGF